MESSFQPTGLERVPVASVLNDFVAALDAMRSTGEVSCPELCPIGRRRKGGSCMSPQNEEASRLLLLAKQDQSAFDALLDAAGVPTALAFFMRSNPSKRHSRLPCICAAWNFKELMISRS